MDDVLVEYSLKRSTTHWAIHGPSCSGFLRRKSLNATAMKLLYTALIGLCVTSVSAQFTLNASNYGVMGTTYEHEHAFWGDTLDFPMGPNQSWDFLGVISDQTRTITYFNPADSEAGSAVNGSTIVLRQEAEVEWSEVHYAQNSNQLEEVYVNLYDGCFLDYSEDPKTMMTFPVNYGDSMTDTFAGLVSFPGEGAWARSGEQSIYLAGHGSLTLSYGTINNVMLVRVQGEHLLQTRRLILE